jgi:S1-C subfamily serine protease
MHAVHKITFMAVLALCATPDPVPAGEAAAPSTAAQRDTEKALAEAQQRLDAAAREVAELSSQMGRRFNFRFGNEAGSAAAPRALLGVNVDSNSTREGARVMEVSPGGAAAEAGIRQGDIITAIADLDLTKDSNPSRALVEKMNLLQPDRPVKVAVLRDGRTLSFDITPRPAPQDMLVRRPDLRGGGRAADVLIGPGSGRGPGAPGPGAPGPGGPGPGPDLNVRQFMFPGQAGRGGPGGRPDGLQGGPVIEQLLDLRREDDSRFGGAELASLSERLGSYFGVRSGVLVVRAGVDSPFKLQDGDVILAVDGREISSAQQAGRILRSYQPGEKLTLRIQRDRKVQNLEITAPGSRRPN